MALTSNNLELIKAVANNDIHAARRAALASLAEDRSKKNAHVTDLYRKRLVSTASSLTTLPPGMQTFLVGETPESFNEEMYCLRECDKEIYEEIRKMKLIAKELADRGIRYRNTTLLYGVSGTGKTEFAKYVAHRLRMPFFYISFASMIDSLMGNTAKNIHKVFEFCSSIPCVLMLDEVDCISMKRASGGSKGVDGELERTTIAIMQCLDRLPNGVTLIAATNRIDIVDDALLRRFSLRHEMFPMSEQELAETASRFLSSTGTAALVSDESVAALVKKCGTPGEMIPELTRMVGAALYDRDKDRLEKEEEEDASDVSGVWRVKYTWETSVQAETEDDAIAEARKRRTFGGLQKTEERYEAKRAEYLLCGDERKD